MTRRLRSLTPFTTGVVTALLIIVVVVVIFINMIPGGPSNLLPWNRTMTLQAVLPSADGLDTKASVEVAGVQVGDVRSITNHGNQALVVMGIQPQYFDFHRDAVAAVRPHGLLGTEFVEIQPGSSATPKLGDGATIGASSTPDPVDLDQILQALQAPEQQSLRTAIVELGEATAGKGGDINHLLAASDTLTQVLNGPVKALDSVSPNLSDTLVNAEAFNADFAQTPLDQLVRNTNTTLQAFAANAGHLQSLLTHADSSLSTLDQALAGQSGNVRQTLQQLPGLLTQLDQFTSQVALIARNLTGKDTTSPHDTDATQGIIAAIENPRSAFSSYDCTVTPPAGQSCPAQDRNYYLRIQVFNFLGLSTPPLPALPSQLCSALQSVSPSIASAAGCAAVPASAQVSPGSTGATLSTFADFIGS